MIKSFFFPFLFAIALIFSKIVIAQTYNFSNYTVESGLLQSQILSVFQDTDGVMWFGTNEGGVTKFDGNNYEHITDKNGLVDNVVYSIKKDKKGRVLIGTNNGLSIWDGKKFKNYTTQNGLSHNRIFTIFIDTNDNAILGTGKGITQLNDTTCKVLNLNETLNNSAIFNVLEDSKHTIWYCTIGNGVFRNDGLKITNYENSDGLKANFVYSVLEKENNSYWILSDEGIYELKNNKIKRVNKKFSKNTTYYSYLRSDNNITWIGSSNGLIKLENNNYQLFTQKNGLVDNDIWKIFQDREKNLWLISKTNGISKLASERFYILTENDGLLFNSISSLYQSKNGKYWIGSNKGLSVFDGKKITNYNQKDWKFNDEVTTIAETKNGTILIGTSYGLLSFDGHHFNRIEAFENKNGLNYIHDIFVDSKKDVWLGTKTGVAKISKNKIIEFKAPELPQNFVYKIVEDKKGNYWFGADDGLYKFDGKHIKHFTEKDGFSGKRVYNIISDSSKNLWIATNAGVVKYANEHFSSITEKDGLSSNNIQSIVFDKKGILWVGLPNGVDRIQLTDNGYLINHYGVEDGFIGKVCNFNSILVDNQNKIWFGAEKGLMVYQSQYDRKNELEPITRIKAILLYGQKTDWKFFADSVDQNNLPVNLKLDFNRNYVAFNFVGVSLTTPTKVSYKYMLKGVDKSWLPETQKTEVSYTNIPPGNYEFLVIANNGEGVWNKKPVSFKFTINPPFWQTWWFYSIIAIIVISGIYSYVKIKSSNIKIVKQSQIIKVKNEELKNANLIIAEKNKNITDSINYAQRIQQSFLSSESLLNQCLNDYFILYKPRDIVSGDFYWAFDLPDRTLIACADSTGHGIPGAFMSLIGISLLNEISHSKKMVEPNEMLDELRRIIICALNPQQLDSGGKDGMDISLISIFKSTDSNHIKIHFSGGNNAMYLISPKTSETLELQDIKGDKQPVGFYSSMKPFTQKEIIAQKGDMIYMFTDGYADQFGGTKGKKFMSKQLKKKLLEIYQLPAKEQSEVLNQTFVSWQGKQEQVDDVTVIGIKI
jgi:ligand-binding sensor domain-containing protein/serine phosphatase RsbU (regulator of sigma subunit)